MAERGVVEELGLLEERGKWELSESQRAGAGRPICHFRHFLRPSARGSIDRAKPRCLRQTCYTPTDKITLQNNVSRER